MRGATNPKKDKKIFRRSAAKSKAVNLGFQIYRGGTRF